MPRERNIASDYDQGIDPAFRREDGLIAPVGTYPIPSKDCAYRYYPGLTNALKICGLNAVVTLSKLPVLVWRLIDKCNTATPADHTLIADHVYLH